MKKNLIYIFFIIIIIVIGLFTIVQYILQDHDFGGEPLEVSLDLLKSSSHFNGKHFHNTIKERDYDIWVNIKDFFGDQNRTPPATFPLVKPLYTKQSLQGFVPFGLATQVFSSR
jgi:hypothetical protein